jgi:hypothetical protein
MGSKAGETMALFETTDLDIFELRLGLAIQLFDRFTQVNRLFGKIRVRLAGSSLEPFPKPDQAMFLFFDLQPGAYTVEVRSNRDGGNGKDPPYYLAVDIPINLPLTNPLWPAFPDVYVANRNLPLDDPAQSAIFRAQRSSVMLQPTVAYPFPAGSTLVRGTVLAGGNRLANARIRRVGDTLEYTTGTDGEYVLFFNEVDGMTEAITVRASHPFHADVDQVVEIQRGRTVVRNFIMAP